jgi:S1-C subfamily serine protease
MKFAVWAAALACCLSASLGADAQVWRSVGPDISGNRYELDVSSLRHEGSFTTSWYRMTLAQDQTVKGTLFKRFHSEVIHRVDNCANGAFADAAVNMLDASGAIVSSTVLTPAQLQFTPAVPGSISQVIQRWVCGEVARRAGLVAALQVGPTSQTQWKLFGTDAVNGVQWFFAPDSIKAADDLSTVLVEGVSNTVSVMASGPPYKYYFGLDAIDCDHRTITVAANDVYEEGGDLVYTYKLDPNGPINPARIAPGSIGDMLSAQVCGRQAAPDSAPAGPDQKTSTTLSSGTAWLGPKGYLITANHVVDGANAIDLVQDGKIVGAAEVVIADPANDIAVLRPRLTDGVHAAIPLRSEPVRLGEKAVTLGYPDPEALGPSIKLTAGEVSATAARSDVSATDPRWMQISTPIQPGNSGGPVLDADGRAIGIVLAKQTKMTEADVAPENVNYALKINYVANLLDGLPDIGNYRPPQAAKSALDAIDRLEGSVFLIAASIPAEG